MAELFYDLLTLISAISIPVIDELLSHLGHLCHPVHRCAGPGIGRSIRRRMSTSRADRRQRGHQNRSRHQRHRCGNHPDCHLFHRLLLFSRSSMFRAPWPPLVGGMETTMQGPDEKMMKAKRDPDKEKSPKETHQKGQCPRAWNLGASNGDRQSRSKVWIGQPARASQQVLVIRRVTTYGSMLAFGRRSSM